MYPKIIDDTVGGLTVRERIPNLSSIGASLDDYEVLPGIRRLPLADFNSSPWDLFYAKDDIDRSVALAEAIRHSGEIAPLIVVIDSDGPYILEGGHRLAALHLLGIKHFPALVVKEL